MPLFGPPNIEKMETKRDVKGLIKALGYYVKQDLEIHRGFNEVRSKALCALVRIGAPAVEPLITALKVDMDEDWDTITNLARCAAADALGQIGDARAVEPLIATFKDSDRYYYKIFWHEGYREEDNLGFFHTVTHGGTASEDYLPNVASRALVKFGMPVAKPLIALLGNDDCNIPGGNWRNLTCETLLQLGTVVVEPLIAALQYFEHLDSVMSILGQLGDIRAVEPLIASLKMRGNTFRPAEVDVAAKALVGFGAPAVEPLIAALQDDDWYVRMTVAKVLGQIGDARAVEPLNAVLQDSDKDVRQAAFEARRKIYAARAV